MRRMLKDRKPRLDLSNKGDKRHVDSRTEKRMRRGSNMEIENQGYNRRKKQIRKQNDLIEEFF